MLSHFLLYSLFLVQGCDPWTVHPYSGWFSLLWNFSENILRNILKVYIPTDFKSIKLTKKINHPKSTLCQLIKQHEIKKLSALFHDIATSPFFSVFGNKLLADPQFLLSALWNPWQHVTCSGRFLYSGHNSELRKNSLLIRTVAQTSLQLKEA